MQEALERWSIDLFREQLPRIFGIMQEINRRLICHLAQVYPNDPGKWEYMAVMSNGEVRMANLCLACCHMVNGVSKLHTEILETTIFRDYYNLNPHRFTNVTNGIAYRRWLCQANPELTAVSAGADRRRLPGRRERAGSAAEISGRSGGAGGAAADQAHE